MSKKAKKCHRCGVKLTQFAAEESARRNEEKPLCFPHYAVKSNTLQRIVI